MAQYPTAQITSIPLSTAAESLISAESVFTLDEDESSDDDNVAYLVGAGIGLGPRLHVTKILFPEDSTANGRILTVTLTMPWAD